MVKRCALLCICVFLLGCSTTTPLTKTINISEVYKEEPITRIAVFDLQFNVPTSEQLGKTSISRNPEAGKIIADLLISELVGTGLYRVVERTEITKILREGKFGSSSLVSQEDVKEVGALLGVDGIVLGAVHNYDLWDWHGGISWGSHVSFSARLVSVETGEIVWAISGSKNTEKKLTIDLASDVVKATICELKEKLR